MKQKNYEFGKRGEEIARQYLIKNNYKIIVSNYSNKFGEIDIVATINDTLVFVEVKLKNNIDFGYPEEMISPFKLNKILRTAEIFLMQNPKIAKFYPKYQIDAVCIVIGGDTQVESLNHYKNITF